MSYGMSSVTGEADIFKSEGRRIISAIDRRSRNEGYGMAASGAKQSFAKWAVWNVRSWD